MGKKALEAKAKEDVDGVVALKKRTAGYEAEYDAARQTLIDMRREAKLSHDFFMEPEAKLIFVVRIVGIIKLSPKPRKVLQLLRLKQIHNGAFVKVNKPMLNMLKLVQPYVTYGYPTLRTVRELVYKRGFGKVNKQRIPLSDNSIIKQANNFLWPFKLSAPKGGFKCKRHGYCEQKAGDWGNREEMINELVARMN